jgi:hypothetical protein
MTPEGKLRLGGMALRNGLLVHGPTHWAAAGAHARRRRQGRVRPQAAPARGDPPARGAGRRPAREAFVVIPLVQARAARRPGCPSRTPACSPWRPARRWVARCCGATCAAARRGGRRGGRLGPARAVRAARRRPRRVSRRRAQGDRRLRGDAEDAADASKEHDRCGSHLVAPMLAANLAGTLLLRRAVDRPGAGRARGRAGPTRPRVEVFAGCRRPCGRTRPRSSARFEIQRLVGTREPDERQLEVGRAALAEILRAEDTQRNRVRPAMASSGRMGVSLAPAEQVPRGDTGGCHARWPVSGRERRDLTGRRSLHGMLVFFIWRR